MRKFGVGFGILGERVYDSSIFWTLLLYLEEENLPILMELENFIFPQFFGLN